MGRAENFPMKRVIERKPFERVNFTNSSEWATIPKMTLEAANKPKVFLSKNLKYFMKLNGWTNKEARAAFGCSGRSTLRKWLTGASQPKLNSLICMAHNLEVCLDTLVFVDIESSYTHEKKEV